jgi:DNA polymerase I
VSDLPYREVWLADFEFASLPGERPEPACLVALELRSGRKIRLWRDQFGDMPPYPLDENSLFVAYFASAEMCCHRVLGWPMPARVLDLFTEFRDLTNGRRALDGGFQKASLLDALNYFGTSHIDAAEKTDMRARFIAGNFDSWTYEEREAGLDYCETDVVALSHLLPAMLPKLDLQHALLRGRYSGPAVSAMQHEGVPIDAATLRFVLENWDGIIDELIARIDVDYCVYEGRTFKEARFEAYLAERKIPWDRTAHGHLKLDDDTFTEACKTFPALEPLRNLRHSLGTMRLNALPVGKDGTHAAKYACEAQSQIAGLSVHIAARMVHIASHK